MINVAILPLGSWQVLLLKLHTESSSYGSPNFFFSKCEYAHIMQLIKLLVTSVCKLSVINSVRDMNRQKHWLWRLSLQICIEERTIGLGCILSSLSTGPVSNVTHISCSFAWFLFFFFHSRFCVMMGFKLSFQRHVYLGGERKWPECLSHSSLSHRGTFKVTPSLTVRHVYFGLQTVKKVKWKIIWHLVWSLTE